MLNSIIDLPDTHPKRLVTIEILRHFRQQMLRAAEDDRFTTAPQPILHPLHERERVTVESDCHVDHGGSSALSTFQIKLRFSNGEKYTDAPTGRKADHYRQLYEYNQLSYQLLDTMCKDVPLQNDWPQESAGKAPATALPQRSVSSAAHYTLESGEVTLNDRTCVENVLTVPAAKLQALIFMVEAALDDLGCPVEGGVYATATVPGRNGTAGRGRGGAAAEKKEPT